MENNIIIAGAGTMGKYYARNLVNMWDELNMTRLTVVDTDEAQLSKIREISPRIETEQADATSAQMRSIVQVTGANGLIGATQTDSHLDVLKAALTVGGTTTQIRHLLQEKPFGMFGEQDSDFNFIRDLIRSGGIHMNLDSILMFSDIYTVFADILKNNPDLQHQATFCTYGKNRTKDTRPAHMGVFGMEGTHAIDIARRVGHTFLPLEFRHGTIVQGYLTDQDSDTPYEACCVFDTDMGKPVRVEMSLAFDKNYRRVQHEFNNANGDVVAITLEFDYVCGDRKLDTIQLLNKTTSEQGQYTTVSAGTKMQSALRATFGKKSDVQYGIEQATDLRRILNTVMSGSTINKAKGAPKISTPFLV